MTDSIMPIAVALLAPLCGWLAFQWWQAVNRGKRFERILYSTEQYVEHLSILVEGGRDKCDTLRGALRYYSCHGNWQSEAGKHSAAYRDKGAIARKALQGES